MTEQQARDSAIAIINEVCEEHGIDIWEPSPLVTDDMIGTVLYQNQLTETALVLTYAESLRDAVSDAKDALNQVWNSLAGKKSAAVEALWPGLMGAPQEGGN